MPPKHATRPVADEDNGIRLDRWFRRHFPVLTHGQLQKLLRTGQVRINGKRVEASQRVETGQEIRVPPQASEVRTYRAEKSSVPREYDQLKKYVLFEDDDVIVLNKPAGLAVQGGTGLRENIDDMLEVFSHRKHGKPKLVHRLDRDTSGVLLIARSTSAAAKLSASFRARATKKIYWGLTLGVPIPEKGRIDAALIKKGELMTIAEGKQDLLEAKAAITVYQNMEVAKGQAAFVAMWPITGRTHQLRVHMASLGHPLVGDRLYEGRMPTTFPIDELGTGLHLHARQLIIPHPRQGTIDVSAPLGPQMRKTWKWFGFDKDAVANFDDA